MKSESVRAIIGAGCVLGIIGVMCLYIWFGSSAAAPKTVDQSLRQKRQPKAARIEEPLAPLVPEVESNSAPTIQYKAPESFGQDAYYQAKRVCQAMLKSPTSAKFSNPNTDSGTGWSPYGYYQWKASGFVDAKNALGVVLREEWFAIVQYNIGKFEVVYLKLGDQTSGTMPEIRRAPGT